MRPPHSRERLWAITQSEGVLIFSCSPLLCSRSPGPLAWLGGQERKGLFDGKPREWSGRAGEWERLARARAQTAPRRSCLRTVRGDVGLDPREPVCTHVEEGNSLRWKPGPLTLQPFPFSALVFFWLQTSVLSHDAGPWLQARGLVLGGRRGRSGKSTRIFQAHPVSQQAADLHNEGLSEACAVFAVVWQESVEEQG